MPNTKHYVITAITLGIIGAASAAAIGVTNLITKNKIAENEKNKIQSGIAEIFGNNSTVLEEKELEGEKYTNIVYTVQLGDRENIQYAFRTDGSNMYGKISLLVGFTNQNQFKGMSIIDNEQTYASTLVENYVDPVANGTRQIEDVSCGATYGAKLIRDMINDAQSVAARINTKE